MIMKTVTMLTESQKRAMLKKLNDMLENGCGVSEISSELHIPESEILEAIEWAKNMKTL